MRLMCIDRQLGFLQFGRTCGPFFRFAAMHQDLSDSRSFVTVRAMDSWQAADKAVHFVHTVHTVH